MEMFLRYEGKKIVTSTKTNNLEPQMIVFLETPSGKQHETYQKLCLITDNTITIPPYHISIAPLKAIDYTISNNINPYT